MEYEGLESITAVTDWLMTHSYKLPHAWTLATIIMVMNILKRLDGEMSLGFSPIILSGFSLSEKVMWAFSHHTVVN